MQIWHIHDKGYGSTVITMEMHWRVPVIEVVDITLIITVMLLYIYLCSFLLHFIPWFDLRREILAACSHFARSWKCRGLTLEEPSTNNCWGVRMNILVCLYHTGFQQFLWDWTLDAHNKLAYQYTMSWCFVFPK